MEIFGIGGWELLLIAILAIVILGPKRMIVLSRKAGELLRKYQPIWNHYLGELHKQIDSIQDEAATAWRDDMEAIRNQVVSPLNQSISQLKDEVSSAARAATEAPPASANPPAAPAVTQPAAQAPSEPAAPSAPRYPAWTEKPGS